MNCTEAREMFPAYVREPEPSLALRRHLATCAGCRAELDRYRELVGALASLRSVSLEPPAGLEATLASIPSRVGHVEVARRNAAAARTHIARNKRAYIGGLAVVAGAAGAALWRSTKARRPATA